jgi:spore maturation protein SpmB
VRKIKIGKLLFFAVFVFISFGLCLSTTSATLQIEDIVYTPIDAKIYEPFRIEVLIYNPDNVSHFYKLFMGFTESTFTEIGYIGPEERDWLFFTAVAEGLGNESIFVHLYQDGGKDLVDERTETVIVEKTDSTYDYILGKIQILETEIDGTKYTITILNIVIVILVIMLLGIAWLSYRKFGVMDERICGVRRKLELLARALREYQENRKRTG